MPVTEGELNSSSGIASSLGFISANKPRIDFVAGGSGEGEGVAVPAANASKPASGSRINGAAMPSAPRRKKSRRLSRGIVQTPCGCCKLTLKLALDHATLYFPSQLNYPRHTEEAP